MAAGRGRSLSLALALALFVAAATFRSSDAATYVVGDAAGWDQPSNVNDDVYDNWVLGKTFYVGDVLTFNFVTGVHDVAQVTAQAADDCIGTNPISMVTAGPANITLTTTGMNYFICTKAGHCDAGQELKINVLAATGPVSPPGTTAPSPAGSVTPPPPFASAATSVAASAVVFVAFLSAAAAFLY